MLNHNGFEYVDDLRSRKRVAVLQPRRRCVLLNAHRAALLLGIVLVNVLVLRLALMLAIVILIVARCLACQTAWPGLPDHHPIFPFWPIQALDRRAESTAA